MTSIGALARHSPSPASARGRVRLATGGKPGEDRMSRSEAARAGTRGSASAGGRGTAGGSASKPGAVPSSSAANPFGAGMGNAQLADKYVQDKYIADPNEHIANERDYWNAVKNLGKRARDYENTGNTSLENFGNFLAGLASISEIDPTQQALGASVDNEKASWGVDPLGLGMSLAGMATGLPLGSTYSIGKKITGWDGPMLSFDGFHDQSPFSNSVQSPVVSGGSTIGSMGPGATPQGKGDQSGTVAGLGAVPVLPAPSGAAPDASAPDEDDADEPTTQAYDMTPYPYDPLKFGETIGGWNFWPNGQLGLQAARGGKIAGPGSGQDDKIPAMLSDGEYVWSAQDVADLGEGSTDEGVRRLDKMRQMVRSKAGRKNPTKIAPRMHSIGDLMRRAA